MTSQPNQPGHSARPDGDHDGHCWVICPTGTPDPGTYYGGDDEFTPHYPCRDDAIGDVSDLGDIPVQLPKPCYVQTCDSCSEGLADDDYGSVVHWISPADATGHARAGGWTSDGRDWHCPACPDLTTAAELAEREADAAREPGSQDQMLPGLGITRADVTVLGAGGVIHQQAAAYAALGDADEDGAGW